MSSVNIDTSWFSGRGADGAVTSKTLGLSLDSDDDVDIVPSAQDENDEKFTEGRCNFH